MKIDTNIIGFLLMILFALLLFVIITMHLNYISFGCVAPVNLANVSGELILGCVEQVK